MSHTLTYLFAISEQNFRNRGRCYDKNVCALNRTLFDKRKKTVVRKFESNKLQFLNSVFYPRERQPVLNAPRPHNEDDDFQEPRNKRKRKFNKRKRKLSKRINREVLGLLDSQENVPSFSQESTKSKSVLAGGLLDSQANVQSFSQASSECPSPREGHHVSLLDSQSSCSEFLSPRRGHHVSLLDSQSSLPLTPRGDHNDSLLHSQSSSLPSSRERLRTRIKTIRAQISETTKKLSG